MDGTWGTWDYHEVAWRGWVGWLVSARREAGIYFGEAGPLGQGRARKGKGAGRMAEADGAWAVDYGVSGNYAGEAM